MKVRSTISRTYPRALVAVLLALSLLWSSLLQAEHIHLAEHSSVEESLLCQHSVSAAVSAATVMAAEAFVDLVVGAAPVAHQANAALVLPPVRAPPVKS